MNKVQFLKRKSRMQNLITQIIVNDVKNTNIQNFTMLDLDISRDGSVATAYVSILGPKATQEKILREMNSVAPFIRKRLGQNLNTYNVPRLTFKIDESYENAQKIEELLAQIKNDEK